MLHRQLEIACYRFILSVAIGYFIGSLLVSPNSFGRFWNHRCVARRGVESSVVTTKQDTDNSNKRLLYIAVISRQSNLHSRVSAAAESWMRNQNAEIEIFVGMDESERISKPRMLKTEHGKRVIQLPALDDDYPPQKKSFMMLKYIHDNHIDKYDWFLRLDDDSYVKVCKLQKFLRRLDPSRTLYIGSPGFGQHNGDYVRAGENYCMGGPGEIFSRALLKRVGPDLSKCLRNLLTEHEDIELGRCIQRITGVKCTESYDAKEMFRQNYKGSFQVNLASLSADKRKSGTIFHANKDSTYQYEFHRLILEDDISRLVTKIAKLERDILRMENLERKRTLIKRGNDIIWLATSDRNVYAASQQHPVTSFKSNLEDVMNNNFLNTANYIRTVYPKLPPIIRSINVSSSKYSINPLQSFDVISDMKLTPSYTKRPKKVLVIKNAHFRRLFTRNFSFFLEYAPINLTEMFIDQPKNLSFSYASDHAEKIHIVVPLSGRTEQFINFLSNYEKKFLTKRENTALIVVYVSLARQMDQPVNSEIESPSKLDPRLTCFSNFREVQVRHSLADLRFVAVHGHKMFSRSAALQEGVRHVPEGGLMLFCDVDFLLGADITHRIRRNTVNGSSVYFPVFFSHHNPDIARLTETDSGDDCIGEKIGFWREYSLGMVSMFKSDFLEIKGFRRNIEGWGLEDLELADAVARTRLQIFRANEPAMIHLYHKKYCPTQLTMVQWHACELSRAQHFGPKILLFSMWMKQNRLWTSNIKNSSVVE